MGLSSGKKALRMAQKVSFLRTDAVFSVPDAVWGRPDAVKACPDAVHGTPPYIRRKRHPVSGLHALQEGKMKPFQSINITKQKKPAYGHSVRGRLLVGINPRRK